MHIPCSPHSINNALGKAITPNAHNVRVLHAAVIKFKGKARNSLGEKFKVEPLTASGVRWMVKHEQQQQLLSKFFDNLRLYKDWLEACISNKWSEVSASNFHNFLENDCYSFCLGLVEMAASVDVGTILSKLTYTLESDQPLIFVAYDCLWTAWVNLRSSTFDFLTRYSIISERILREKYIEPIDMKIKQNEIEVERIKESIETKKNEITMLNERRSKSRTTRKGRKTTNVNFATLSKHGRDASSEDKTKQLQEDISSATKILLEKETMLRDSMKLKLDFSRDHPIISQVDLFTHGKKSVEPCFSYLNELYFTAGGELNDLRIGFRGVEILNPLKVDTMSNQEALSCIDDLCHLPLKEFRDTHFIQSLRKSLDLYLDYVKKSVTTFDWDTVKGAYEYNERLNKKIIAFNNKKDSNLSENEDQDEDFEDFSDKYDPTVYSNWKEDPIERARRIWCWWKCHHEMVEFCWSDAARFAVLLQVSSASVERVFSQLQLLVKSVGQHIIHDNLEARLFTRCNKDYPVD